MIYNIKIFPKYYLDIPIKYNVGVDIMIEAKAKEAAILDLFRRYQDHFLGHIDPEEIDEGFFKYNHEKMHAEKCNKCMF